MKLHQFYSFDNTSKKNNILTTLTMSTLAVFFFNFAQASTNLPTSSQQQKTVNQSVKVVSSSSVAVKQPMALPKPTVTASTNVIATKPTKPSVVTTLKSVPTVVTAPKVAPIFPVTPKVTITPIPLPKTKTVQTATVVAKPTAPPIATVQKAVASSTAAVPKPTSSSVVGTSPKPVATEKLVTSKSSAVTSSTAVAQKSATLPTVTATKNQMEAASTTKQSVKSPSNATIGMDYKDPRLNATIGPASGPSYPIKTDIRGDYIDVPKTIANPEPLSGRGSTSLSKPATINVVETKRVGPDLANPKDAYNAAVGYVKANKEDVIMNVISLPLLEIKGLQAGKVVAGVVDSSAAGGFFKGTKYSQEVLDKMSIGNFHSFPEIVQLFQKSGKITNITGGDGVVRKMLSIPGGYGSKDGFFEFIKEANGTISHYFFRPK